MNSKFVFDEYLNYDGKDMAGPEKPLETDESYLEQTQQQWEEQQRAKEQQEQQRRIEGERVQSAEKAKEILESVSNDVEREKSRERIADVVLKEAGIRINTSIRDTSIRDRLSRRGTSGFQNLETRIQDRRQPYVTLMRIQSQFISAAETRQGKELAGALRERGIKELVDIRHDERPVRETVIIPGSKGILGIGRTPDRTERRDTGRQEFVPHSEIVNGGRTEPAVRITYYIPQTKWRDYSGRSGQMMVAEIVLSESTAREVEQVLEQDPATIRKIIERVMKERLLREPSDWEIPPSPGTDALRPPYEKWDAESNGGAIYIQKEGEEPGFHGKNFRKLKK